MSVVLTQERTGCPKEGRHIKIGEEYAYVQLESYLGDCYQSGVGVYHPYNIVMK